MTELSLDASKPADHRRSGSSWRPWLRDLGKRAAGRAAVGLSAGLGSRAAARFGILLYHRICPHVPGVPRPTMNVTPERFRSQLLGLQRRGFRFWSLERALSAADGAETIPPRTVVLTFDDGFANLLVYAADVLRELDIRGTVFLPTAYLDSEEPFPFDPWAREHQDCLPPEFYRSLTRGECRGLWAEGILQFGAHTHTHGDFRGREQEFATDLRRSLDIVGELVEREQVPFAFPFGKPRLGFTPPSMMEDARQSGASCALTTEDELADPNKDPFGWGRFNVYQWDSGGTLAAKLHGWYSWAASLPQVLSRNGPATGGPG